MMWRRGIAFGMVWFVAWMTSMWTIDLGWWRVALGFTAGFVVGYAAAAWLDQEAA